jgi:plasmid stability protein
VDIPDPIYRRLKARAAQEGRSIKELVLHGVEAELNGESPRKDQERVTLPLIRSKRPGWLKLTNKTIDEILLP